MQWIEVHEVLENFLDSEDVVLDSCSLVIFCLFSYAALSLVLFCGQIRNYLGNILFAANQPS